jgi:hypothetical protein
VVCQVYAHKTDLIHARIGEQEGGIVKGDGGGRLDECMVLGLEVVEELLADASGGPWASIGRGGRCSHCRAMTGKEKRTKQPQSHK